MLVTDINGGGREGEGGGGGLRPRGLPRSGRLAAGEKLPVGGSDEFGRRKMTPGAPYFIVLTLTASVGACAAHHLRFRSPRNPNAGRFVHPAASHRLFFTSHAPSGA